MKRVVEGIGRFRPTRKFYAAVVALGMILWIIAGVFWYTNIYMNPERRFWRMIDNSLQVSSVLKTVTSKNSSTSQTQYIRLRIGSEAAIETKSIVEQRTVNTKSKVVTNSIVTPEKSFVRYESVATDEKNSKDQTFDFSPVLGKWAVQETTEQQPQTFAENFVQLLPIANLSKAERREIIDEMKSRKVYEVDFNKVREDSVNNFTVYSVKVNTREYVGVLNKIFDKIGLAKIEGFDESQYDAGSSLAVQFAIDGSNMMRRIGFEDDQYESYGEYGVSTPLSFPTETISYTELQEKLQALQ